ncbi:MAG TPA: peptidoglycan recognition family protein, partial [Thermoanaerobaculia bacterium]|nr:peptidoglycan recognition family protein [Thermoanaerobaculia bacterium]
MAWKDIVGARFSPAEFDDYVRQLVFTDWRPQFVVVHNTGSPSLADRPAGFTPAHMQNFVHYYRDTQGWSAGPHCFVDQNGIWVFTPLTTTGVHSPSWNSMSWGVETLGDYSTEAFTDPIHEHLVACLATLHAVIPLDVNNLHFHKEDPLTTHLCPGVNIIKPVLIHDVQTLISSRQTLADPARGRYTGASPAEVAPESHFFADHGSLTQTDAIAYGPVTDDKENKYRVTGLVKATADVNAYAAVSGIVMIQRVADENNPGTYLPNVVNLVLKPYKQPIKGFTRVKYFIYRNLRLDAFLKGTSAADEALVRNKTSGSSFIQNLWTIHTAQNGTAPFQSTVLGFDPANQLGTAGIDKLFHRQNANEQLPFAARGDQIGTFYTNSGADAFGIEILLEGDFEPDYDYVRTSTETVIDVSGAAAGTDSQLQRARILNYLDPAAFYGMHMAPAGWLEVQSGSAKKKLKGVAVYNDVVQQFATHNTLYIDVRNENGL